MSTQNTLPISAKPKSKKGDYNSLSGDSISRIETQPKNRKENGSRRGKISINHLLEFQLYRDLPEYQKLHQRVRRSSNHNREKRNKLHLHGMSFINVNYKFVVDHRKRYRPQQVDPNVPVETQDILRIIVPKGNSCPICLSDDLVAPRMISSCGHILCLTCLISLLESEVPVHKKKESKVIVEKYIDCPLCGSVIRKNEIKPVQIDNVDERFEVPKIDDDVVLTLLTRQSDRILPLPRYLDSLQETIDVFPWANQTDPDLSQYLRFFKGDLSYLIKMYEAEKEQVRAAYEEDKQLYGDDGKYVKLALKNIDDDIAKWAEKFATALPEEALDTADSSEPNSRGVSTYYYYQTGFKSSATYVLSPLDVKVIKTSYNQDYTQLPFSVIAKVENIKYEELTAETALTKYKYLSHLPQGTLIGFLECKWQQNEYISEETWNTFKGDLQKRSKLSQRKFNTEEKNRRRAIVEEESRAREYIERANNGGASEFDYDNESWMHSASMGSLSITDYRDLPALSAETHTQSSTSGGDISDGDAAVNVQKTIWGTTIPKGEVALIDEDEYDWDAEEMIRRAREEMEKHDNQTGPGKKKKKKKLVLLSSGSWS